MRQRSTLAVAFGAACAALLGGGCSLPPLVVEADAPALAEAAATVPPATDADESIRVWLDGRLMPRPAEGDEPRSRRIPYFGTAEIVVHADGQTADGRSFRTTRELVTLEAPAPRWMFPFDFFGEAIADGWRHLTGAPDPQWSATVTVDPRPDVVVDGVTPTRSNEALRERARRAAWER